MRAQRASQHVDMSAPNAWLMKIGEVLRTEYTVDGPLPEMLAALLGQIESTERSASRASSTYPRCKFTMVKLAHGPGFGGHPDLGGYRCPRCKYIT
jgi:hypothetical protein